jgi:hypothetical protein
MYDRSPGFGSESSRKGGTKKKSFFFHLRDFGALTECGVLFDKIAIYLHVSAKKEKNSENSVL